MRNINFPTKSVENSDFLENLSEFFDAENLQQLAQYTKFIQRSSSKLTGLSFLSLHVFENESLLNLSLSDACEFLEHEFKIGVTKQSLDERYNTFAVQFLKKCLSQVLNEVLVKPAATESLIRHFRRIRIADSTSYQLTPQLATFYQSGGGDTSPSSIKIQYEYDLIAGEFIDLQVGCGKKNDAEYLQTCLGIKPKDLAIKDLGYYQHEHFYKIAKAGGYFISRYKAGVNLYKKDLTGNFVKVSITELTAKCNFTYSMILWLGEEKLPVRVILSPVPKQVADERLRKLNKKATHKKWNASDDRKRMCQFNIFITNVEEEISDDNVIELYKLRWQIELLFKIWKSLFEIDNIGHTNIFRFECYLYGRLIALCLAQNIQGLFKEHLLSKGFELSEWKAYKVIKKNSLTY